MRRRNTDSTLAALRSEPLDYMRWAAAFDAAKRTGQHLRVFMTTGPKAVPDLRLERQGFASTISVPHAWYVSRIWPPGRAPIPNASDWQIALIAVGRSGEILSSHAIFDADGVGLERFDRLYGPLGFDYETVDVKRRNSDANLRELERRVAASPDDADLHGVRARSRAMRNRRIVRPNTDAASRVREREALCEDPHARARVLVDRMRSGLVQPHHLAVAGWLGDEAAGLVVPAWVPPESVPGWSYPARHAVLLGPIKRTVLVRLAADMAFNVLRLFEAAHPGDMYPRRAIEAAWAWAVCPCEEHRTAADAAVDGGIGGDVGASAWNTNVDADVAAQAAAYTAAQAASDVDGAWVEKATDAAAAAVLAAEADLGTAVVEHEWQRMHMIAVLRGDSVEDPLGSPPVPPPPTVRNPRPPKGQPTRTNLYALARLFAGVDEVPNQIDQSSVPHIRRCLAAGLVEVVDRKTLRLTPTGLSRINEEIAALGSEDDDA